MDIVERLKRWLIDDPKWGKSVALNIDYDDVNKAIDEIERLREQNAELVEEIKKLKEAKEINKYASYPDDGFGGYPSVYNRR